MISKEFPLYQNTTFVQEGDTGNSDVDKFVGTNFCEVGTCYGVGESSDYNKINNFENAECVSISNEEEQLPNSLETGNNPGEKNDDQNRVSKRRRFIPKVFTPESNNEAVWCLCQRKDFGFYIVCDLRKPGCLEFYHPACVGLGNLKSTNDCKKYSNCSDGKSYICPLCAGKVTREQWYDTKDILSISRTEHEVYDVVMREADSLKIVGNMNYSHENSSSIGSVGETSIMDDGFENDLSNKKAPNVAENGLGNEQRFPD
jgi:hypothetical protein